MKMFHNVLTAKGKEVPLILDAVTNMEYEFMWSTSNEKNIQKALDDPEAKERMMNSITKFLELNELVHSFNEPWPKECKFTLLFDERFRKFLLKFTPETYFEFLVKKFIKKEQ